MSTPNPISLPVLDISNPTPEAGKAVLDAATKYGFLYVDSAGTEFGREDVEGVFEMSRKFFASPVEEKRSCTIQSNNRGWSGMHTEILDPENQRTGDFKEAMNFGDFNTTTGKAQQPLPSSLIPHENDLSQFASKCNKTCERILTLLALGLEINPTFLTTRHNPQKGPTGSILRLLYYPSFPSSSDEERVDERAGAHSDYGSITLLFQRPGQPGLEILSPDGSGWRGVSVFPDGRNTDTTPAGEGEEGGGGGGGRGRFPPILVNIGDLLTYWTDGLLKSTVHRVVFPSNSNSNTGTGTSEQQKDAGQDPGYGTAGDRYSIVYFCHPLDSAELVPLPSPIVSAYREENKTQTQTEDMRVGFGGGAGGLGEGKRALTAKEHLEGRLDATYGFRR